MNRNRNHYEAVLADLRTQRQKIDTTISVLEDLLGVGLPTLEPKKRPGTSRDHDFATVARRVVEEAIGEKLKGEPLDEPPKKNPAAVALGRLGGLKGGKARATTLSPERRREIAQRAAERRWSKD